MHGTLHTVGLRGATRLVFHARAPTDQAARERFLELLDARLPDWRERRARLNALPLAKTNTP